MAQTLCCPVENILAMSITWGWDYQNCCELYRFSLFLPITLVVQVKQSIWCMSAPMTASELNDPWPWQYLGELYGSRSSYDHRREMLFKWPVLARFCYMLCFRAEVIKVTLYTGWQWRNFVTYLRQMGFAAILWVKLLEMFVMLMSLKYCMSVGWWSCGHFLKLTGQILFG